MSILPAEDRVFEVEAQVLIVGGGACGLTAALAAHDAGVAPLVLERDRTCLGSSSMSLGAVCAAGSAEQRLHGVDDDAQTFFQDIMRKTRGEADEDLARTLAAGSGPALDWLSERHGVCFGLDLSWKPAFGHTRARMHATPEHTGLGMMARLSAACERASVDILNSAHVTDLYADPAGRVRGVRCVRPGGAVEEIGCKALVLASCGFSANAEMIAAHIPDIRGARHFGWEGNQGDAVLWGQALGGATADMGAYQGLGLLAEPQGIDVNPKFLIEGGFQVNARGERFSHELDDVSGQAARVIAEPGGIAWVIYDERVHEGCADLPQYRSLLDLNARKSGDNVEDLATVIGADPHILEEAFAEANRRDGSPDRFGRLFGGPVLAAPYHALRVTGALFHTQGGLVIDRHAQVLRRDGAALPNLFAGGGAARGVSGSGGSGYLPGAGLCTAITLGRIAGDAAARMALGGFQPFNKPEDPTRDWAAPGRRGPIGR